VKRIADAFLMNPKEISVAAPSSTADTVEAFMVRTSAKLKREVLRKVIASESVTNALIFCNRKRDVDVLATSLRKHGFKAAGLHGDMAQSQRTATLQSFRDAEINMLVATDVAGRGIDIRGLSHVFNFDVPFHAEDYIHRIGRTGRAGLSGRAITLVTSDDGKFVDAIEHLIKKKIAVLDAPPVEADVESAVEQPATEIGVEVDVGMEATPAPAERSERPSRRPGRQDNRRDHRTNRRPPRERTPDAPHEEAGQQAEAIVAQAPREQREHHESREQREPRQPRQQHDANDRRVVGLGDHVPAFLQRPVPLPRTGTE
jgi:superfamily II DNA/RNA helicase